MSEQKKIPKRVATLIDRMRRGDEFVSVTLCKAGEPGSDHYCRLEPSGRSVGPKTLQQAVDLGLIAPSNDGLFGDWPSQTWRLPA